MKHVGRTSGVIVSALGLVAAIFVAPAQSATTSWNGPAPAIPGATKGGTLTILNQGDFEHLDPARNYVGGTLDFYRFFIRSLTNYRTMNGKLELLPDLAADLGTTKDGGKTWTFKLRSGMKYEDGTAIKCADFKYGVERSYDSGVLDGGPTYASDWIENLNGYAGPYTTPDKDLSGVTCSPKGDAITFKLQQAIPYFPSVVTFGAFAPVPKAKDTKQQYDLHPIGSGPYKIDSYDRGKQLTLVRNKYWDAKSDPSRWAYPDKIQVKMGFDQAALEQTLIADAGTTKTSMSMDTDIVNNLGVVVGNSQYASRFLQFATPYARYYAINMDTVKDLKVRQAIQCALDLKTIVAAAGGSNAGSYANSTIPPTLKNAYRSFNICGRDPIKNPEAQTAKAKELLAAATIKKTNLVFAYRDKGVEPDRAAAVQAALEAAGFTVTMQKLPRAGYYSAIGKRGAANTSPGGEPDLIQASWGWDWAAASGIVYALYDGRTMTDTDGRSNYSRQNVASIQTLFEAADKLTDVKASDKALGDIEQKIVVDQAGVMPAYFQKANALYGSKLGGVQQEIGFGTTSAAGVWIKK
jgi:peptide/nickel transport system substrate-binding protein